MSKTIKKTIILELTENDIDDLLNIADVCSSHLQDYDLGDPECPYNETDADCDKWKNKLYKLSKEIRKKK